MSFLIIHTKYRSLLSKNKGLKNQNTPVGHLEVLNWIYHKSYVWYEFEYTYSPFQSKKKIKKHVVQCIIFRLSCKQSGIFTSNFWLLSGFRLSLAHCASVRSQKTKQLGLQAIVHKQCLPPPPPQCFVFSGRIDASGRKGWRIMKTINGNFRIIFLWPRRSSEEKTSTVLILRLWERSTSDSLTYYFLMQKRELWALWERCWDNFCPQ